ncbi:anti-sigma factor [Echinicola pacifica]|uniref:Anti-sigma factor n=1 Tax=Echinicola pacifica TaxID=346377 RepID=A0A918PKC6_9BACT|nr:FecR family protein [Echinicola pacifica]GGZ12692.1 anti-sigma factor [Echinicola pacifica]
MDKAEFIKLLQKQEAGKTSPAEDEQIDSQWQALHEQQAAFVWTAGNQKEVRDRIKAGLDAKMIAGSQRTYLYSHWWKVAAILLLVGLGAFLAQLVEQPSAEPLMVVQQTNGEQRKRLSLPDGTLVILNVNSQLEYPEKFPSAGRKVTLRGEAFFEVHREEDRPFTVSSPQLETRVLGTSFNVQAYGDFSEMVTVSTGLVEVTKREKREETVRLQPDQAAVLTPGNRPLAIQQVDAARVSGWKASKIIFDKLPFDEVVQRLRDYYHRDIILENYTVQQDCLIKVSYENSGIHFILSGLKLLVDFDYRENEAGQIKIHFNSCNNP